MCAGTIVTMVRRSGPITGSELVSITMLSTPAPAGRLLCSKARATQPSQWEAKVA